ncbi:MerR family transcriptional regulator [Pararhodospirillum oryzae]|uniref:MerR family transcriptional regulator n=1 Tax=Pararhodospirillum oryzae TaxID=478448 RepID=A0A512H9C3_9PROT|nr:helix-turn-helix domain-containing protein [Pararhodospirillum oryzae]GEO82059.1 MerR family transcriptional regulator [Pararhodospirillum oryzae]
MTLISIGRLSDETGTKIPTIRYYESIGLLPEPPRTASNRRLYDPHAVARLRFIRHARDLGFEIEAIRDFLGLMDHPGGPCHHAHGLVRQHLEAIDAKIAQLQAMRHAIERVSPNCPYNRVEQCPAIEVLSDHALCPDGCP